MSDPDIVKEEKEIRKMKEKLAEREKEVQRKKERRATLEREKSNAEQLKKEMKEHPWKFKAQAYYENSRRNSRRFDEFRRLWGTKNYEGTIPQLLCIIDDHFEKHEKEIRKLKKEIEELKRKS